MSSRRVKGLGEASLPRSKGCSKSLEAMPAIYKCTRFSPNLTGYAMLMKRTYTSKGDVLDGAGLALSDGGGIMYEILDVHFGRAGGMVIVKRR